MTTIAANRELMAGDSQATDDSGAGTSFKTQKIWRIGDSLFGCAGDFFGGQFLEWAADGFKAKAKPNFAGVWDHVFFEILELAPDGLAWWDKHLTRTRLKDDCYAIGSGASIALLLMRKYQMSPENAVLECCEIDEYTKGPVDVLYLKEPKTVVSNQKGNK